MRTKLDRSWMARARSVRGTVKPLRNECSGEETEFLPNLKEPTQLCEGRMWRAHCSGWEPGR